MGITSSLYHICCRPLPENNYSYQRKIFSSSCSSSCSSSNSSSTSSHGSTLSSTFTCMICMEEQIPPTQRFKSNKYFSCSRYHAFCQSCITQYIASKLDFNIAVIKCPSPGCKRNLDCHSCRAFLPSHLFVRWCDVKCELFLGDAPKAFCPNKECSELVVDECKGGRKAREVKCPCCKEKFCFQCKAKWHEGLWCIDGEVLGEEDTLFNVVVKEKGWQRCPKCETCIERTYGCFCVKCRCGHSFCYWCGDQLTWFPMLHKCPYLLGLKLIKV